MPTTFQASKQVIARSGLGEDRAVVIEQNGCILLALADGAGGMGGGAAAAEMVLNYALRCAAADAPLASADGYRDLLAEIDSALSVDAAAGETTGIIALLSENEVIRASVGDSQMWLIRDSRILIDLTEEQRRKPLLGSGEAVPVAFSTGAMLPGDVLLLGSDGLFNYAPVDALCRIAGMSSTLVAEHLVEAVRLPSGDLCDDVGVIVVRAGVD